MSTLVFGAPEHGEKSADNENKSRRVEPSAERVLAERLRALATRLLQKYGVSVEGQKYESPVKRAMRQRPTTVAVWDTPARKVVVTVEDVLWTNILASQCMIKEPAITSVMSDYKHLWDMARITADDVRPFVPFLTGRSWVNGEVFELSNEQLAMIVTLAKGAPVDSVDVTAHGKFDIAGEAEDRVYRSQLPHAGAQVRSAAWINSTMGSGKSIVAWFVARHVISDAGWSACTSNELVWAASTLNGGVREVMDLESPTLTAGDFDGVPGITKRVVWIVCKSCMEQQWKAVVEQNMGDLNAEVHVLEKIDVSSSSRDYEACKKVRTLAYKLLSDGPTVFISSADTIESAFRMSPIRVACVIHDENGSLTGNRMKSYRTLVVTATPARVFDRPSIVSETMQEMLWGDSTRHRERDNDARATAWSRFVQMNPMPDIQIENSVAAITRMPTYIEVENVEYRSTSSSGSPRNFQSLSDFICGVFEFMYSSLTNEVRFNGFSNGTSTSGEESSQPNGMDQPRYAVLKEMALNIIHDMASIPENVLNRIITVRNPLKFGIPNARLIGRIHYAHRVNTTFPAYVKHIISHAQKIAAATEVECTLCGGLKPYEDVYFTWCCGSFFCSQCSSHTPHIEPPWEDSSSSHRPCSFCTGHYDINVERNDQRRWGVMTAAASALRVLRKRDASITKFLVVAAGAPKCFNNMFEQIVKVGEPGMRVHTVWTPEAARACAEHPSRVDVFIYTELSDVDGLDMGAVDAVITIGDVKNKQQLYSRVIRTGARRRNTMCVVQVINKDLPPSSAIHGHWSHEYHDNITHPWTFMDKVPETYTRPKLKIATFSPVRIEIINSPGGINGFLKKCRVPVDITKEDEEEPTPEFEEWMRVVDRVELEFIAPPSDARTVPYAAVEVRTPRVSGIGWSSLYGYGTPAGKLSFIFASPFESPLVPEHANTICLALEQGGWEAYWGNSANAQVCRLHHEYDGMAKFIRLRMYATKPYGDTKRSFVFVQDNVKLTYEAELPPDGEPAATSCMRIQV